VVEAEHVRVPVRLTINIKYPCPLVLLRADFSIIFPELLKNHGNGDADSSTHALDNF
jgi:hypothetical protein